MAAYPFRKMTTRQLRKLLKDDRERNRILTEPPDRSASNPPAYSIIKNPTDPFRPPRFQPSPVNRYQLNPFKSDNSGSHPSACMDTHPVRVVRGNIMRRW